MPELPEVQTIAAQLQAALVGATIESVRIARADIIRHGRQGLAKRVTGRAIREVGRHGKRMTIRLVPGGALTIHLGMSGRLTLEPSGSPVLTHTHLRMGIRGTGTELRFRDPRRFGGVWFHEESESGSTREVCGNGEPGLSQLGPDALTIRTSELKVLFRRRRRIKALLLDQQVISGLGNIYCDEALHRSGIHPMTEAAALSEEQVRRLAVTIRQTLRQAINFGGTTFREYRNADGGEGRFQKLHRVYGREGQPCPACGALIVRSIVAGRSTHLCLRCQRPLVTP